MIPSVSSLLRRRAALAGFVVLIVAGALQYRAVVRMRAPASAAPSENIDFGPFYLGVHLTEADRDVSPSILAKL